MRKNKTDSITFEEVDRLLNYNPDTGIFTWKIDRGTSCKAGSVAGGLNISGYMEIRFNKITIRSHRLAWLISNGSFPVGVIDHINRDKADNRLVNLRDVSYSENNLNRTITGGASGNKYISISPLGRYYVTIQGKRCGTFDTIEEAILVRNINIGRIPIKDKKYVYQKATKLTKDTALEKFRYDAITGIITNAKNGNMCLTKNSCGYLKVSHGGNTYTAHRLAWLMYYGVYPNGQIDHINRDKTDNSINNLRIVSRSENNANRSMMRHNTSGYRGVDRAHNKWRARIMKDGVRIELGLFDDKEEAYEAYKKAFSEQYPNISI